MLLILRRKNWFGMLIGELEKRQKRINQILSRIEKNISKLESETCWLSEVIKLLKKDFLEFVDFTSSEITDKLSDSNLTRSLTHCKLPTNLPYLAFL